MRALAWLCLALSACQMAGPATSGPGGVPPVVVAQGDISRAEQAEAERLLESAEASFEARRFLEALRTTAELLERYPASSVSGEAVLLSARAELEAGAAEAADAAAERYIGLLPPADPRAADARLIQVRAWDGTPGTQLDRLLRIETFETAEQRADAESLTRAAMDALEPDEIEEVLAGAPDYGPLTTLPQALHAVTLLERGQEREAATLAQSVLQRGVTGRERSYAESVARGELPEDRRPVRSFQIATVLPSGGPPVIAEFARQIAEGVGLAVATVLDEPYEVTLLQLDDQGDSELGAELVAGLDSTGVAGVIGFLEEGALRAAGQARQRGVPLFSPTARSTEGAGEGVYSLDGPDPQAAAAIARYAAWRAFQRVAILLPGSPDAFEEAYAFQVEAERLGIPIVGYFSYEPGETFFESQIIGARNALRAAEIAALGLGPEDTLRVEMLEPVGIFLPIPPEDVEYLAPQIAHFALDTLGIELVGTSGWTDSRVLEVLEPRYTNGVVATAPGGAAEGRPGFQRFRAAYEEHFQRSLTNMVPAVGYDAALVLLEALRPGRIAPPEVRASLDALTPVEGATGTFTVVDGRVVRETRVVRIENGRLAPVPEL
ncbi:MAG TPA: ABC transporter substrate-binding protein [Longimicrobiales bacterium]|nr:ABC transporter substrate-binding protein [Longimicrobiales bacterium]